MKQKKLIVTPRAGKALQDDLNRVPPRAGAAATRIKQVLKLK